MTILSTDALTIILETLVINPRWSAAAKAIGGTERTCFAWLAASKKAEAEKDTASVYFLEFMSSFNFFHCHCATSRRLQLIRLEGIVRAEAQGDLQEPVLDSNHRQVWQEDSAAVALWQDDSAAARDLGGLNDYPYAHDEHGARIPLMRSIPMAATLRSKVLEQIGSYTPHQTIDIRSQNQHVVRFSGGPGSPVLQPPSSDEKVQRMLADAKAHLANPDRRTKPDDPMVAFDRARSGDPSLGKVKPLDEQGRFSIARG